MSKILAFLKQLFTSSTFWTHVAERAVGGLVVAVITVAVLALV